MDVVRGDQMAVIEEFKIGNATVRIHDDYIRSREESEEILQRVADNMLRYLNAKKRAAGDLRRENETSD
jgi:hypothetical protein